MTGDVAQGQTASVACIRLFPTLGKTKNDTFTSQNLGKRQRASLRDSRKKKTALIWTSSLQSLEGIRICCLPHLGFMEQLQRLQEMNMNTKTESLYGSLQARSRHSVAYGSMKQPPSETRTTLHRPVLWKTVLPTCSAFLEMQKWRSSPAIGAKSKPNSDLRWTLTE